MSTTTIIPRNALIALRDCASQEKMRDLLRGVIVYTDDDDLMFASTDSYMLLIWSSVGWEDIGTGDSLVPAWRMMGQAFKALPTSPKQYRVLGVMGRDALDAACKLGKPRSNLEFTATERGFEVTVDGDDSGVAVVNDWAEGRPANIPNLIPDELFEDHAVIGWDPAKLHRLMGAMGRISNGDGVPVRYLGQLVASKNSSPELKPSLFWLQVADRDVDTSQSAIGLLMPVRLS